MLLRIRKDIKKFSSPQKVKLLLKFFKTGKGEYGEGDIFVGINVPNSWIIARKYKDVNLGTVEHLLHSKIHEERLIGLMILVLQFEKGSQDVRKKLFEFYLTNTKYINNWDLVDTSADHIVGGYLLEIPKLVRNDNSMNDILLKLAKSKDIWERRIAIIATYEFIRNNIFKPTLSISEMLLSDKNDLIHKAVGWMLREVGKRDQKVLEQFLQVHYLKIPRTTLRYAIEHFPQNVRKSYLCGEIPRV